MSEDIQQLKSLIEEHTSLTGSVRGKEILDNFDEYLPKFKKIIPHEYARMLKSINKFEADGMSHEEAKIEAFYANIK